MIQENKNKVTIIVPVYNAEKHIGKCLESILNQTYKNISIIVINDGSKDNSQSIIEKYKMKYPNIILINQENSGVSKTRNKAIKLVNTKYVMFIDNDDFIDIDYVQKHLEIAENEDCDVVISGYRRPNEKGKTIKEMKLKDEEWSKFMIFAPWAKIYKTEYLIQNDIEFLCNNIGEDVFFNIQALQLSKKIKIIDYVGYNWYFNTESVSNTIQKNYKDLQVFNLLDNSYEIIKKKKILQDNYEINELYFYRYIIWFLLFSMKKAKKDEIDIQYDKMFYWLKKRFPNYKNNKLICLVKPKGEIFSLRLLYCFFNFTQKLKCGKLFIYILTR